jgi:hypothetical protein
MLGGCALPTADTAPKVVKSEDGKMELTIPSNWNGNTEELHEEAELRVSNMREEKYVIVLNEEKDAFDDDITLKDYRDLIIGGMEASIENSELSETIETQVNGNKAMLDEIEGSVNKIKVIYWIYSIETEDSFVQIIGWTLQKDAEKNKDAVLKVMNSFKRGTEVEEPPIE